MGIVSFNQLEDAELMNDQIQGNFQQGVPEEQQTVGLDLTADEIIEVTAEFFASFKCKTYEGREEFKRRYITTNKLVLTLIGFNEALRQIPVKQLPPQYALFIGFAVLIVSGIFIKVDESKYMKQDKTDKDIQKRVEQEERKKQVEKKEEQDELVKKGMELLEGGVKE